MQNPTLSGPRGKKTGGGLTECTEPACGSGGETHQKPGDLKTTATRSSTFRLLSGSTSRRGKGPLQHLTPPLNKGKKTTIYAWFRLFLPPLRKRGSKLPEHLFLLRGDGRSYGSGGASSSYSRMARGPTATQTTTAWIRGAEPQHMTKPACFPLPCV